MVNWRRLSGVAGLAAGAIAAGAGAVVMAEKIAVGRIRLRPDPAADESFGGPFGEELTVPADDGLPLHVQLSGPPDAPVTIIFCHGYTLNADVWYYQRAGFSATARCVLPDQRSHGRSGRSDPELVSIDQLGADLHEVLMATAPGDQPVVLVGHSMGGMTVMALADQHPELFGGKVIGVALISTAATAIDPVTWLPVPLRPAIRLAVPSMMTGASRGRVAGVVERGRQSVSDIAFLGTRHLAFGDPRVSPTVVDFLERIIRATPIDVIADFYVALTGHEKRHSLKVLNTVPVLVLTGDRDRLVDPAFSEDIANSVRDSELVTIHGAGHVVILERPEECNAAIAALVTRALAGQAMTAEQDLITVGVPGAAQMRSLGARLAGCLRAGDLVVLTGPLGAGKTTLVQGIGAGLDVRGPITSPTFVIARVHPSLRGGPGLVHADAYRLGSRLEVDDLDLDADIDRCVTVVEWGEGLVEGLTQGHLLITISWDQSRPAAGEDEPRQLTIAPHGERWQTTTPDLRKVLLDP